MKVIFANGTAVNYKRCEATKVFFDNANREARMFKIDPAEITLDTLDALTISEDNTVKFTLVGEAKTIVDHTGAPVLDEQGNEQVVVDTSICDNYCLRTELKKALELVDIDKDGYEVMGEVITVTLARLTRDEVQRRNDAALLAQLLAERQQ